VGVRHPGAVGGELEHIAAIDLGTVTDRLQRVVDLPVDAVEPDVDEAPGQADGQALEIR
jgi:hypothetical protein